MSENSKYTEYKSLNYVEIAREVLQYWKDHNIFEKSVSNREGSPEFTFYEGPPSANGTPGIHHVMARTVKDLFCRFKTLKGFQVKRKGGWDTHGLPVELQVEKELGITKEDIGTKISIEDYNRRCKEAVMKYKDEWDNLTEQVGYWVDLDHPYITYETNYIESLWYLLKELYSKGLLYEGYTIQPYSPAAGTGLSSHELNQPGTYKDISDTSIVAQFKIAGKEDEYFLAWTTTPWTLPANSALAIGEKLTYVKIETFNVYTHMPVKVILAKDRVKEYFNAKGENSNLQEYKPGDKIIPWKIIEELSGKELVGMDYEQLMPYVPLPKPAFTVVPGDFVTTEEGTGIVHISKTFGADDFRTCVRFGIPGVLVKDENGNDVPIVDKKGRFVKEITDFAGMYVKNYTGEDESVPGYKSTDVKIAIRLKEENKAFLVEKYVHSYPHCWRTDKPILYYPLDSWFIKTTAFKDKLVELNNTINWKPASTGKGRFGNWLENLVDWNLSRSRFWGTPLPIWITRNREEFKCIGSIKELRSEIAESIKKGFMKEEPWTGEIDLHRPYVDQIVLKSAKGEPMFREPDLVDVWFDSGAMPYAQWHYPFENNDVFEKAFPADFIAEGVDQTRGWFFTLHAIAGMLFESVAFKNVISNGLVLDKDGNKMSKRLGNAVDPFQALEKFGPDSIRWYMIANANPWDNLKFNPDGVSEVQRKFFGTLHNTYSFFALYANLDGFNYAEGELQKESLTESDRWILSRLNTVIKEVGESYEDYEPTKGARTIQNFVVNDLSNWYVRLNRKRFWKGEYNEDKKAAYQTLYECLLTVAKLASPIAPFYMDKLFQNLNQVTSKENVESVHLTNFPESDTAMIEIDLEERMELAQNISSLVHSIRKSQRIKVRQPLSKILIPVLDEKFKEQIQAVEDLILNEVNTKGIEYIEDDSNVIVKKIKPNFRKLGQEYGSRLKDISNAINNFGSEEIRKLEKDKSIAIDIPGGIVNLSLDDVEIFSEDIPGWSIANEGKVTVALDITVTEDLKMEGIARDFVNRIQNIRKEKGLEVQDKIEIMVESDSDQISKSINKFQEYICNETQALSIQLVNNLSDGTELTIDELHIRVSVNKAG